MGDFFQQVAQFAPAVGAAFGPVGALAGSVVQQIAGGGFRQGTTGGQEQYLIATFGTGDQATIRQRLAECGVPGADVISLTLPLSTYGITPAQALAGCGASGFTPSFVPAAAGRLPGPMVAAETGFSLGMLAGGPLFDAVGRVNFPAARVAARSGQPVTLGDFPPPRNRRQLLSFMCQVHKCNPTAPGYFAEACRLIKRRTASFSRSSCCKPRARITCRPRCC